MKLRKRKIVSLLATTLLRLDQRSKQILDYFNFAMRVSALICFGAAIAAALLVRKVRHADEQRQPLAEPA